jgi:hypothetical protein
MGVLIWIALTGVAWLLDLRVADRNPALEWSILSLRFGGPLAAIAVYSGHRFGAVGPSFTLGFILWNSLLGGLALVLECMRLFRHR